MKKVHSKQVFALILAVSLLAGVLWPPSRDGGQYTSDAYSVSPIQDSFTVSSADQSGTLSWGVEASRFPEFVEQYRERFTGTVTVAVIDTGVDFSHPYLGGAVDQSRSRNFTDSDTPEDRDGHGTHIAGIIKDCLGDALQYVDIVSLKAMGDEGHGLDSDLIEAINYAAEADIDVINLSLSGPHNDNGLLDAAIEKAVASGVLVVAASGNDGEEIDDLCPAHIETPGVITVGSGSRSNQRSQFSNWAVDLIAPGEDIYSSIPGGYATFSGTSMSCGFVTAAAALLKLASGDASLTAPQLEELVKTATASSTWEPYTGYGFLDLMEASLSGSSPQPAPAPVKPKPEAPETGSAVTDVSWKFFSAPGTYTGGWDGAAPHGKGTFTFDSGNVLELTADWTHGQCDTATGREKLSGGDIFEGGYKLLHTGGSVSLIWCGICKIVKTNGDWVESTYSETGDLLPGSSYHHADGRVIYFD